MSSASTPIRAEAAFWLIITVGLAVCIGIETDWGRQTQWPVMQTAGAPPVLPKLALAEPFQLAGPDQFPNITLRPLFIVTRSPAPPAPLADSSNSGMRKDQFVLVGTTIVGEGKFAFLLEKAGNRSRVVAEGKEINGIMVKEVSADRVVLSQNADTEVLLLKASKLPAAAQAPISAVPRVEPPVAAAPRVVPPPVAAPRAPQPQPQPAAGSMVGPR